MHVQVPTAVFSQPPMGTVGLTEAQAVERLAGDIDVFISKFKPMKNTLRWVGLLLGV
jgi:glutathione reductase (NADPH)